MTDTDSSFWSFSLRTYAKPGVAEACLALQDQSGVDVNVLLFLLWTASQGQRLELRHVATVVDLVKGWQEEVVRPLRGVRRFLKSPGSGWPKAETEALRQHVKAHELEAERLQHQVMESFARASIFGAGATPPKLTGTSVREAAAANVGLYAGAIGISMPDERLSFLIDCVSDSR